MHSPKLRLTNSLNQGDDLNGVDAEIKHIVAAFEAKETEENWTQFDDALVKLKTLVRNNGSLQGFNTLLKRFKQPLNTSLSSERTKLARTGLSLVECLSEELGERLDGNIDILLPPVLKLCNRANKVFVSCASATLKVIIDNTRLPSILPYLYDALHNPTKTLRIAASDGFVKCLDAVPPHRLTNSQDLIESFIKESAEDSAAEVRESARQVLLKFRETFPNRVDRFISELNGAATKNLKIPKQDANKRVPIKQKLIALREVGVKAPLEDRIEIASSQGHPPPTQYQEINQDFSDLKVRGTQQVPIPGSTHGLSSRRLLERPTRVVHGETNVAAAGLPTRETTAWGAQRVLRDETLKAFLPLEVSERPVPLKSKAMRVPSAAISAEPSSSSRPTSPPVRAKAYSESLMQKTAERKDLRELKRRPTAPPFRTAEPAPDASYQVDLPHDFSDVVVKLRSHDWSVRFNGIDSLKIYSDPRIYDDRVHSPDVKTKLSKILDLYTAGLGDSHSKVATAAANGLKTFLLSLPPIQEILNSCLPRLVGALNQKQRVNFTWKTLYQDVKEQAGVEPMLNALLQGLQSVEFSKNGKVRGGCCQLFAEFSVEDWQAIGKPVRAMPHKLLTTYSEIDITARLSVKTILTNIHTAFPDLIGSTWTSLKPTDRRTLNGLFGGSGSLLDKFILDATKKPALIRASLDVRSPSPTSTTVNTPAISPKSMIARAKRSSIARSTTSVDSSSSMYASSMGSSELIDRSPGKLFVSSSAASQLGDTIQRARSGSKGSLNGFGSTTQSTVNSKLSAAYEDSDTDWVTDSEVLRSPTESENEFTLGGVDNDDNNEKAFLSAPPSLDAKRSAFFIEKPVSLQERFGKEMDENANTLKELELILSLVDKRGSPLHASVPPSAEAVNIMQESLPKASISFSEGPFGDDRDIDQILDQRIMLSSTPDQADHMAFLMGGVETIRGRARASSIPLDENERLNRTLSLLIARENPDSIKESLKELRKMIESGSQKTIEALPSYLPKILTSNWETITSVDDDQLEIDYELDTLLECIDQHAPTDILLAAFGQLDDNVVFESRPTFELLEKVMRRLRTDENPDIQPLMTCIAKGLDSGNPSARKSAFDCAVHLLRIRPVLEEILFGEIEKLRGKSRVVIIRGMIKSKLQQS